MSYEIGNATSYMDLLDRLNTFLRKGHTLPPVYAGAGTGQITGLIGTASSVQEAITVTLTSASSFTVAGSVTGAMGSGTVGTLFTHARCAFTVVAGGTAWANGDTITFVMTPAWAALRSVAGSEYIWQAPGNSNQDQIIVGAKAFTDPTGGYYNWRLLGATGFDAGQGFTTQPGNCSRPVLPLWNSSIPYWFIADGRCVKIIAKITTVFEHAFLGFPDTYGSPGEYPYPLIVGGSMSWATEPVVTSQNWKYSYVGNGHQAYWCPYPAMIIYLNNDYTKSSFRLRLPNGFWTAFSCADVSGSAYPLEPVVYPYDDGGLNVQPCLDGSVILHPIWFADLNNIPNVYGEFPGIKAVSGVGRGAEDTVTIGHDTYLVAQNIAQTTTRSYAAFLLA